MFIYITNWHGELISNLCSDYIWVADQLQYQSLDAVNNQGMFMLRQSFLLASN